MKNRKLYLDADWIRVVKGKCYVKMIKYFNRANRTSSATKKMNVLKEFAYIFIWYMCRFQEQVAGLSGKKQFKLNPTFKNSLIIHKRIDLSKG